MVGKGVNNVVHPLFNQKGHITVVLDRAKKNMTIEKSSQYGIFRGYRLATASPDSENNGSG